MKPYGRDSLPARFTGAYSARNNKIMYRTTLILSRLWFNQNLLKRMTCMESKGHVSNAGLIFAFQGVKWFFTHENLLVARGRIELPTRGFSVHCSTDWATWPLFACQPARLTRLLKIPRPCCFSVSLAWSFLHARLRGLPRNTWFIQRFLAAQFPWNQNIYCLICS